MPEYKHNDSTDGIHRPPVPVARRGPGGWVVVAAVIAGVSLAAAVGFWALAALSPRDQLYIAVIGAMWAVNAVFFWWQWAQARQRPR